MVCGKEGRSTYIHIHMRGQISTKRINNTQPITTTRQNGRDEDLAKHRSGLALSGTVGGSQSARRRASRHSTVRVADQDHILVADVQEREDQSVAHVVGVVGRRDLPLGANAGEEASEGSVAGGLEEVQEVGVVGWVLGGAGYDDEGGLLSVGGDGHDVE